MIPAIGKLRFLIVDDFESFRLSMRQILRALGAEHIEVCGNGATALQRCTYENFDVVLCDFNLGAGKNGQHILEELRHRKLIKCTSLFIMVTAETSKEMVMGAREHQPDAYLTKPINQAMMAQRMTALIRQRAVLAPINREIDLENLPAAVSLCVQMLPQQPRYKTWILKTLSDLYFRIGDFNHARMICEDILQVRDIPWARLGLANIYIAEQRYSEANTTLQSLIASQPDCVEAYDAFARSLAAQGKISAAQRILERAAVRSPHAILRQQQLARIANENQDLAAASDAWRRTIELGKHSIHDSATHYLELARSLSELCEDDLSEQGQAFANEASTTLLALQRRFNDDQSACTRAMLVQARVHAGQHQTGEAEALLEDVLPADPINTMDADVGLELAQTLYSMNRSGEAEAILAELAQRHADDANVQLKIEALLDEPVSFKKKMSARQLNKQGIAAFEQDNPDVAAKAFREALTFVPNHAALNLNLIQVRLSQGVGKPGTEEWIHECKSCIEALSALPDGHRQYKRFRTLKAKVEALSDDS
ncbi:tetratricopeptide repeat protein [Marinobacter sp. 1Y8]